MVCTFVFTYAKTVDATYKISYGIFGELGLAKTTLHILPNNTYKIKVHAYATGIAKILSSEKEEFYESEGIIKDNHLIPSKFVKISKNNYKYREKIYTFDYDKKTVHLNKYEKKMHTTHDTNLEPIQSWKESRSTQENKFFAPNDLLSLFFNIKQIIPSFEQGKAYTLKAIGANKTNGNLDIIIPEGERYQDLQEALKTQNIKFIAAIHQKIFSSEKGELFISLNESGFCNKAVLKDVLIFGDITGEMIDFNIQGS